jgi:hypothetical protein
MSFFKRDGDTPTEELRLKDFDRIWTKFCFLDETGSLDDAKDPYFTIGLLKMSQPYYLQSKILYERNIRNFHDEIKFNKLSKNNLEFAKFVINSVFDTKNVDFYSYTTKKDSIYFLSNFGGNTWRAYEAITLKLLGAALSEQEIIILIADHVTTPKEVRFEVNTKKQFNTSKHRLALAGVSRFDSRSNDLLQVVDLLVGAITYDLKLSARTVSGSQHKIELVGLLKKNLGIDTFEDGFRNKNFNVFVERGGVENEKRQSS